MHPTQVPASISYIYPSTFYGSTTPAPKHERSADCVANTIGRMYGNVPDPML